ncbi:alpha-glucuronidase family glycosyl hydrolase [Propionibacteriaceae bacterium Y2011]
MPENDQPYDHPQLFRTGLSRRRLLQAGAATTAGAATAGSVGWTAIRPAHGAPGRPADEDGYDLWLRYRQVSNPARLTEYRAALRHVVAAGDDAVIDNAAAELRRGITGLTGIEPGDGPASQPGTVLIGTGEESAEVRTTFGAATLAGLADEAFLIRSTPLRPGSGLGRIVVGARTSRGVLYGVFHLLRLVATGERLHQLAIEEAPATPIRIVNHWDNLDRSVERGYAGRSIFNWDALPTVEPRMIDYARTLASVGINATVINNVNANSHFLSSEMITNLVDLAATFRGWGLRLWLSANYAAPIQLTAGTADPITTADPADPRVQQWWVDKVAEIYDAIPDFGGFLVKANSEGQPGPLDYGRTHADGANMLGRAVAPHDGLIIWRSFVHEDFGGWAEYQYDVFAPLNGQFDDNVIVQTKYGPIDFQVREPTHPLFGELDQTNQMLELQLTQEYTGHDVHAVYLVPMWREVLDFTTGGPGAGPTVADIVTGTTRNTTTAGIAGVINFGDDRDWTGYQFGAANTYGFGRLVWDPAADPAAIAAEWTKQTFGWTDEIVDGVDDILLQSWSAFEDYTSPLGMGYLVNPGGAHLEPSPIGTLTQSHHTTSEGTGFDRTVATGTGFTGRYPDAWTQVYEDLATMPDELLLFMHWVPYTHQLHGTDEHPATTVIQHIYDTHFAGVETVQEFVQRWQSLSSQVDAARHADITASFAGHLDHARVWRDTIVAFFFDQSRILDQQRQWLQVEVSGPGLLLGGWPNRIPLEVTNATPDQLDVTAEIVPPDDSWTTQPVTKPIASTETETLNLPVVPPLIGTTADLDASIDPELTVLGTADLRQLVAPAGPLCHFALDGGTTGSAVLPGYTRLSPESMFSAETGFGWVGEPPSSRDRTGNALVRDFVGHPEPRTLRLVLPAGRHSAYLLVGDNDADPQAVEVREGETLLVTVPEQRRNQARWAAFELDGGGAGRTVDLTFTGLGGWWRLNALALPDPDAELPPVIVAGVTTEPVWWSGRANDVVVAISNTSEAAQTVRVELTVPDGWTSEPVEVSVPAGSETDVAVPVTAPADPGTGRLGVTVHRGDELVETGRTLDVVTTIHPDDAVLAIDGGTGSSPLLEGYLRLGPDHVYDSSSGYGWVGRLPESRDRGNSDALRRDIVLGKDEPPHRLQLDLPAGTHTVWVLSGDSSTGSGITTISEAGTVLGTTGTGQIPARQFVWFSFTLDGGAAGRTAELSLTGALRDGFWRIAALIVV